MQFSILVTAGPETAAAVTALHTTEAVLRSPYSLFRVFFYGNGVHLANRLIHPGRDGEAVASRWQSLVKDSALPARVCVGAALRRGVTDDTEGQRAGLDGDNLAEGFQLVGLGEWVDAARHSDRVLHFG
ncbi:sulfur relay protein TusD/DsrE [Alcanivorax balearicus MACL04]|uniref:Sulfur relay protein TusD/DsrE n=1 Tax=Alloalcanivorax balearicus MACL04 TaxID=1177182 RepID=A0ABT2QYT3_9GAMM|nr:sulfurtransferase complex subunit TusD [Alloalcanivorax balearicus]MCU5782674.1 sulfur relay protein TusD/DsrE [Alloalcanivorax balearicus MACL04]